MVSVLDVSKVMSRVEFTRSCWLWHGQVKKNGYGLFRGNYAHRLVYYFYKGYAPNNGRVLDHTCRNTLCVNPDHLEDVTIGENVQRGFMSRGGMTYCKSGRHELTDDNVYYQKTGRACKSCIKERKKA